MHSGICTLHNVTAFLSHITVKSIHLRQFGYCVYVIYAVKSVFPNGRFSLRFCVMCKIDIIGMRKRQKNSVVVRKIISVNAVSNSDDN